MMIANGAPSVEDCLAEPARQIPVLGTFDVCVLGGSCTGVFAAVRAARLGARVAIVEKQNAFGGVATNGLVNIWHSLLNTEGDQTIIAGLTRELLDRLEQRNAIEQIGGDGRIGYYLNTEELKIELDELVGEHTIQPFFHTMYCAPHHENRRLAAVMIENKDGRSAIRASVFVDATGDGDLALHLGIPFTLDDALQPPTTCAKIKHLIRPDFNLKQLIKEHREEFGLVRDMGWSGRVPDASEVNMCAETHVFGTNAAAAEQLTRAEIEGRRQIRAIMDIVRKYGPQPNTVSLLSLAAHLGIRETRRFEADYRLTGADVLAGRRFDDAIANGSYRVDVHNPVNGGYVFKHLDGREEHIDYDGRVAGRWRDPIDQDPTFYQIPFRTMVSRSIENLILAGRMISTDKEAFGAVRVMVNLNQVGEAAGVAAALAIQKECAVSVLDPHTLRETLADGGSVIRGRSQ